jgi:hypothetical protein
MMAEFLPVLVLYGLSYFLVRAVEPRRDPAPDAAPEPL